jgi:hypothetical protein
MVLEDTKPHPVVMLFWWRKNRIINPWFVTYCDGKIYPNSYPDFYEIALHLLTNRYSVEEELAKATADAVWTFDRRYLHYLAACKVFNPLRFATYFSSM